MSRAGRAPASRLAGRLGVLVVVVAFTACTARILLGAAPADPADAIIRQLSASADDWNHGNLEGFIAPYAVESTFMTPAGPVHRAAMLERYRSKYFAGGRPLQSLRFEQLDVRPLGTDYALMTGRFVLSGGALPEQTGRFTLVWRRSSDGWRILHDHSS